MQRIVTAIAAAAAIGLATILPARAAFPALTLIYQVPGVMDSGSGTNVGFATSVQCSNLSGVPATIRVIAYNSVGNTAGTATVSVQNGQTLTLSTHNTNVYGSEFATISADLPINAGQIRIYATRAAIFCNASIVDAAAALPTGLPLHMIRYNAAPGTVE